MNIQKCSQIVSTVLFSAILGGFFLGHVLTQDEEYTLSERRRLAQFPELTASTLQSGVFMTNFEKYSLDHFPFRDTFRSLKALCAYNVFGQKDNNDIYEEDGYLAKMEDYADLARGIGYLLGKDNRKIGQAAQTFVHDTFSPRQIAEQWKEILERNRSKK